jgi:hypothetical protein
MRSRWDTAHPNFALHFARSIVVLPVNGTECSGLAAHFVASDAQSESESDPPLPATLDGATAPGPANATEGGPRQVSPISRHPPERPRVRAWHWQVEVSPEQDL